MQKIIRSFGFACEGFLQAFRSERNIRLFCAGFFVVIIAAAILRIKPAEWMLLIFAGGIFLSVELLNTALEHAIDVIEEHRPKSDDNGYHAGLKAAKDVAAAASLVALILVMVAAGFVFWG